MGTDKKEEEGLPEGWLITSVGDVCSILDSKRIPLNSAERNRRIEGKSKDELFPYYGATGEAGKIDDYLFDGEYVLLGEDAAPFLEPHKGVAYMVNGKFWVNNHAHILSLSSSNRFLCYCLTQTNYAPYVTGTTRLKLNQAKLKEIPFPLPPLAEQKRIVSKIEELFSELDAGVESFKQARKQLGLYRQSLLQQAFCGKLTEAWRTANPDQLEDPEQLLERIRQERESRYQQQVTDWEAAVENWGKNGEEGKRPSKPRSLKPFEALAGEIRPHEMPSWVSSPLSPLIDEPAYGTSKKCAPETQGLGVLRIPNIVDGFINSENLKFAQFEESEIYSLCLFEDDLLMVRSNGSISIVGRCAQIQKQDSKFLYAGYLIRIRANRELVEASYLKAQLESHALRVQIENAAKSTSGVNNINAKEIQALRISLPSLPEQTEIVRILESQFAVIEQNEREIDASLKRADALRQSILKKAFSGQLVSQDPADEPASELLERIRAERVKSETVKVKKKSPKKKSATRERARK